MEKFFHHESEAMEQVAQRDCAISILTGFQDQVQQKAQSSQLCCHDSSHFMLEVGLETS